jgi:hypothetical protein
MFNKFQLCIYANSVFRFIADSQAYRQIVDKADTDFKFGLLYLEHLRCEQNNCSQFG